MPKVPVLDQQVAYGAPTTPVAPLVRPPEQAFGGDVANATERLGGAIERTGDAAFQRVIELKQRDNAQQDLDVGTQAQQAIQSKLINTAPDENGVPKGYLSRQLNQAKGATVQFDQDAMDIKNQYLSMVTSPIQKAHMDAILSAHLTGAREQVIQHEAAQTKDAFQESFKANQGTTIANAATLSDPGSVSDAIKAAQEAALPAYQHMGMTDPAVIDSQNKAFAGQIIKSAVEGNLEHNPEAAQKIFDANKDSMPPDQAAALDKTLTGKMLYDTIQKVSAVAQNFRMADGMIDRSKVDSYVKSLHLPAQEEYTVTRHVDGLAQVDASEILKKRQNNEISAINDIIKAQATGVPYDQALKIPSKYAWDAASTANLQAEVTKLYANPQDKFNTWITRQPQDVQSAWTEAELAVKGKYPSASATGNVGGATVSLQKSAIDQLKQDVLGKSADQIRDIAQEKLKKVVVGPYNFLGMNLPINKTAPGWQVEANDRATISAANSLLEKTYGSDRVGRAKTKLISSGIAVTPSNIKRVLDASLSQSGDNE